MRSLRRICTEAVRTNSRRLFLGRSLDAFMREIGLENRSGGPRGDRTRLRGQVERLFRASVELNYDNHDQGVTHRVADVITNEMLPIDPRSRHVWVVETYDTDRRGGRKNQWVF